MITFKAANFIEAIQAHAARNHVSPEAGYAADAFVRQQQAVAAQDPDFAGNLVRTQLRRLGLADEVMAPDAP